MHQAREADAGWSQSGQAVSGRGMCHDSQPGCRFRNDLTSTVSILHDAQALSWVSGQPLLKSSSSGCMKGSDSPSQLL